MDKPNIYNICSYQEVYFITVYCALVYLLLLNESQQKINISCVNISSFREM